MTDSDPMHPDSGLLEACANAARRLVPKAIAKPIDNQCALNVNLRRGWVVVVARGRAAAELLKLVKGEGHIDKRKTPTIHI